MSKRKFGQPEEEEEEEVLETSDVEVGVVSEGGAFRSQKSCKMTGFGATVVLAPEKVRLQELGSGEMGRDGQRYWQPQGREERDKRRITA